MGRGWAVGIGAALVLGLVALGVPAGDSHGVNLAWAAAFGAEVWGGDPYPRALAGLWHGMGGLDFFFYAPLPFYGVALFHPLGAGAALALAGGLALGLSGWAFHGFARDFVGPRAARVAALAYMVMPYHLGLDWFVRQALGEFAAYAALPLLARGVAEVMAGGSGRRCALGVAALVLCHLPSALLVAPVLGAVAGIWAWGRPGVQVARVGVRLIGAGAAGLALAGLYWVPALALLGDVSPHYLYLDHYVAADWLLFGPRTDLARWPLGFVLVALLAAVGIVALAAGHARATPGAGVWVWVPPLVGLGLMSVVAEPIWRGTPLAMVQFPWRLMLFVDLGAALAVGVLAGAGARLRLGIGTALWLGAAVPIGALSLAPILRAQAMAGGPMPQTGAVEYLPPAFAAALAAGVADRQAIHARAAARGADLAAAAAAWAGGGRILARRGRHALVAVDPGAPQVRLALIAWRHHRARDAATWKEVPIAVDAQTGLMVVTPGPSVARVIVTLPWQPAERLGLAASLGGLGWLVWRRRRAGQAEA